MDMHIREAFPNDAAQIIQLLCNDNLPNTDRSTILTMPRAQFEGLLASDKYLAWIIEDSNRIIGFCALHLNSSMDGGQPKALLHELFIAHEYRRLKLGNKLLDSVEMFCEARKIQQIFVLDKHILKRRRFIPFAA